MLDMRGSGSVVTQAISFPAGNAVLQGTLFHPEAEPVAAVVLNSATGVPHGFYRHFAEWLVRERGMACLTYDYRDFGTSATGPLASSDASMMDWAMIDQPAARAAMRHHLPGVPLWVIGHSLGAMMMPLQDGIEDIVRMIGVASGLVHHRDHPWPYQAMARMFWFGAGPLAVQATGYLPGRLLGFGADLPPQVYWQWREWCTSPRSFYPEIGRSLPQPDWGRSGAAVDLFAMDDDSLMPPRCAHRLAGLYGVKRTKVHVISPVQHGLGKVGHLGAFARRNAVLWPKLISSPA